MLGKRKAVSAVAPSKKRRKSVPAIPEITFDLNAREDYLTGFHKRKLQRTKHAKEEAVKREREERITARKLLREGRKADLEKHVAEVNALLRRDIIPDSDGWSGEGGEGDGREDDQNQKDVSEEVAANREAEYLDEDLHTTVTVEAVDVSRDGLHKSHEDESDQSDGETEAKRLRKDHTASRDGRSSGQETKGKAKPSVPKKKKKKFRYESRAERKVTKRKEHSKNSAQARERKS